MPPFRVFLDHVSSTPLDLRVFEAMQSYFTGSYGNPSSPHRQDLIARDALIKAREQCASFIHAQAVDEIHFTSGGTEANNLAVKGVAYASERKGNHIILSETEHPSVLESVAFLEKRGFTSTKVRVDSNGIVAPQEIRAAITDRTILIAVHHANHDIGAIQPIAEIGQIAAERGIAFFCDATASAGWLPIDVQAMGVTLLSFAPHRFYGPKGIGVLYRNRRARLSPVIHGGVQESGYRAGTENVPAIVGGGVAAKFAQREMSQWSVHVAYLQKWLVDGLIMKIPYVKLVGPLPGPLRSPVNGSFVIEFIEGESLLLLLDYHGISILSGRSCVSKSLKFSHVLKAIGLDPLLAQGSIIMSLGRENTDQEIDYVLVTMPKVVEKLRSMLSRWDEFKRGRIDSVIMPRQVSEQKTGVDSL